MSRSGANVSAISPYPSAPAALRGARLAGFRLSVGMRRELGIDHSIALIADRQGGVIARRQLDALQLSASAIDRRLRAGRLHRLYRGVYAVGHRDVAVKGGRLAG